MSLVLDFPEIGGANSSQKSTEFRGLTFSIRESESNISDKLLPKFPATPPQYVLKKVVVHRTYSYI